MSGFSHLLVDNLKLRCFFLIGSSGRKLEPEHDSMRHHSIRGITKYMSFPDRRHDTASPQRVRDACRMVSQRLSFMRCKDSKNVASVHGSVQSTGAQTTWQRWGHPNRQKPPLQERRLLLPTERTLNICLDEWVNSTIPTKLRRVEYSERH